MSRLMMGISGALALSLISGAAELARGRDLYPAIGNRAPVTLALAGLSFSSLPIKDASPVNRGSKADRVAAVAGSPASTRTVSLKLDSFSDTTFLVRIPTSSAGSAASSPVASPTRSSVRKPVVACEPVVSVLTEVAKRLEPGRCVT
jgi:hypothetical protein